MADNLDALVRDVQSRFTPDQIGIVKVVRPNTENKIDMLLKGDERALELGGFVRIKCKGDGNCVFRALSKALFGNQNMHHQLRLAIIDLMKSDYDRYNIRHDFCIKKFNEYLDDLARDKAHVGYDVLEAAADLLKARIFHTFSAQTFMMREYTPHTGPVLYEINLVATLKHLDALGRKHVYTPL